METTEFKLMEDIAVAAGYVLRGNALAEVLVPRGWTRLRSMCDYWEFLKDTQLPQHLAIFATPVRPVHEVYQFSAVDRVYGDFVYMAGALRHPACIACGVFIKDYLGDLPDMNDDHPLKNEQWLQAWNDLIAANRTIKEKT